MSGVVLSGTEVAAEIRASLKSQVEELQHQDPSFKPGLVIVQVRRCPSDSIILTLLTSRLEDERTATSTSG